MGLLQKAVETYDANQALVGVIREGHEPLAPIGHTLTNANLEITLNAQGKFLTARKVDKSEQKVLIPVTEESSGRTSAPCAHPLCDQLKYVASKNEQAHGLFIEALRDWEKSEASHPFLYAILTYVESGTVIPDLLQAGILSLDNKGNYDEKQSIVWRVNGVEGEEPACWKNQNLFSAFISYYCDKISSRVPSLCMIEGDFVSAALQHPKGIIPINGNAKLISANDSSGFTYRGRFSAEQQAATIGYIASQKAHNALRWLASEQGIREFAGNRIFLCWNPQGTRLPKPTRRLRNSDSGPVSKPSDYKKALQSTLFSFRADNQLKGTETAVLAAFDAATTGRLAVTYYNEISLELFLDRMQTWDAHCCWFWGKFGIQAPNLLQIVECAFGTQRGKFLEVDDRIQRQHLQRLLDCKVGGGVFPVDIVKALIQRASMPLSYDETIWRRILRTACSAIQKYRFDTNQGGNEMEWELDKLDRSFQYGRLLAVMERAEADYYSRIQETRQTTAIKRMNEYRRHPLTIFEQINRHLNQAYLPRIQTWQVKRYEKLRDEIFEILREYPKEELNQPLNEFYLMGYELQRNAFFTKKETDENETEE
jgi:CRISPR-associated protein Csd1